jgi:hypothetical protein
MYSALPDGRAVSNAIVTGDKSKKRLEARVGIEPTHKGFADPFLLVLNLSDSTAIFIKSNFRPLLVRSCLGCASDSGTVLQDPQPRRNKIEREKA